MTDSPRVNHGGSASGKRVLILGAASAIATATARLYAEGGARVFLVARDAERLNTLKADLLVRGAESVEVRVLDMLAFEEHLATLSAAFEALGPVDVALIAHGTLADQKACEGDVKLTLRELQTNALSTIALLTHLANLMEAQRAGTIAVITSVAGDRGRQSNYVYGTAKGAVDLFLQGLRNRLHRSRVHVLTIKPGFVDTPMTKGFKKGFLWARPDDVGRGIVRAIDTRRTVAYVPGYWRFIMLAVKSIPETLFKRMSL